MDTNINRIGITREQSTFNQRKITCAGDANEVIKQFYHEDIGIYESFFLLLLNRGNMTDGYVKISQGGITGTVVDTRLIAKYSIDALATGVILAHNHPSGQLRPSEQDKMVTKKIQKALALFDIQVLDHIILTPSGKFYSFANSGDL